MTPWKTVKYLRIGESLNYEYEILLPEPLASWDVYDYWEKERVHSMQDHLMPSDILYDVGAESGWMSIVFAHFTQVFLIEPTKEFWPNIRQTWEKNIPFPPKGCFIGLVSDTTSDAVTDFSPYPKESEKELIDKNKYQYLYEHEENTHIMSIDDIVRISGIIPTALTIDIEGAELLALQGAKNILTSQNMKVWVSIHPDLMTKYDHTKTMLLEYMKNLGYTEEYLATDHEEHYYFCKKTHE